MLVSDSLNALRMPCKEGVAGYAELLVASLISRKQPSLNMEKCDIWGAAEPCSPVTLAMGSTLCLSQLIKLQPLEFRCFHKA